MRIRSPHENNPFNPLFKVVALRATKIHGKGKKNRLTLDCSLNFKHSQSVTGNDTDDYGNVIQSVTFALSVKRAELSVKISSDEVEGISIDEIAHMSEGYRYTKIETTSERHSQRKLDLQANFRAKFSLNPKVTLKARAATSKSGTQKTKRLASQSLFKSVSGTFDSKEAHWEIEPNVDYGEGVHKEHISGEIFMANDQEQRLKALILSWKKGSGAYVDLRASVYVQLKDLNISDVRTFDKNGDEMGRPLGSKMFQDIEKAKLKIVKQVIKKHLVELDLTSSGGRIEVCRAYA